MNMSARRVVAMAAIIGDAQGGMRDQSDQESALEKHS
jgi:hypothetical protein